VFASNKRYRNSASVGLVLPRRKLCVQVHEIEERFRIGFNKMSTTPGIASKLYDDVFPPVDFSFLYSDHSEHAV